LSLHQPDYCKELAGHREGGDEEALGFLQAPEEDTA